jgi:hypothetical protein
MKSKLIVTSIYEVQKVKDGEPIRYFRKYTHTQQAEFSVQSSCVRAITPALEIIAKREGLDLTRFEQFEMCLTALKHSVSWN